MSHPVAQGPALGAAGPPAPTPSWNKEFLSKHKGPKANSQSSPNPMGIKACAAQISSKIGCLPYFVGQKKLHLVGEPGRGEVAPGLILTLLQRKRQPRPDRAEKSNGCNPKSQFSGSKIGSIHPNRSSGPDSQLSFPWKGLGGNGTIQDLASVPLLPLPALFVTPSGHSIAAPVPFGNR